MKLKSRFIGGSLALLGIAFLFSACELNDDAEDSVSHASLSIEPSYVLIPIRNVSPVVFQAAGGTPPYRWSSSETNTTLGTLAANEDIAVYTPKAVAGSVFLTLRDHQGAEATATLIQQ